MSNKLLPYHMGQNMNKTCYEPDLLWARPVMSPTCYEHSCYGLTGEEKTNDVNINIPMTHAEVFTYPFTNPEGSIRRSNWNPEYRKSSHSEVTTLYTKTITRPNRKTVSIRKYRSNHSDGRED